MSTFNMDPVSQVLEQDRRKAKPGAPPRSSSIDPPAAVAVSSLRFTPSAERRRANLASFVEQTRKQDPAGALQLRSLFASTDIIAEIHKAMAPKGLRTDNLADAYAVWWLQCWSAVHADFSDPDRATVQAVKAQATRALLAGGKAAAASDALKQQFAETLLVQALMLEASLRQARGDPAQLKALASAANEGAKAMGLDMTSMKLTSAGFVAAG